MVVRLHVWPECLPSALRTWPQADPNKTYTAKHTVMTPKVGATPDGTLSLCCSEMRGHREATIITRSPPRHSRHVTRHTVTLQECLHTTRRRHDTDINTPEAIHCRGRRRPGGRWCENHLAATCHLVSLPLHHQRGMCELNGSALRGETGRITGVGTSLCIRHPSPARRKAKDGRTSSGGRQRTRLLKSNQIKQISGG